MRAGRRHSQGVMPVASFTMHLADAPRLLRSWCTCCCANPGPRCPLWKASVWPSHLDAKREEPRVHLASWWARTHYFKRSRRWREHSAEFKAQVVAACGAPGVPIAAVAMANGVNASVARRGVVDAERRSGARLTTPSVPRQWPSCRWACCLRRRQRRRRTSASSCAAVPPQSI